MHKLCGSTLPVLLRVSGGIRRTIPSRRHVPAAVRLLPPTAFGGGPRTQQQGQTRPSSSSSRWKARQESDRYAREARVKDLKSRAAFKLLEIDKKYKLFKRGALVLDLGYAPGSWCQVAMERTKPTGRVLGVDLIPAQPPRGVGTIQGNFLSPAVRRMTKQLIAELHRRQVEDEAAARQADEADEDVVADRPSYIDMEHRASQPEEAEPADESGPSSPPPSAASSGRSQGEEQGGVEASAATTKPEEKRYLDVVLSDMSEPWPQTSGFRMNTLSNPYRRLMNTSGIPFRDHAGSMDLCTAALDFANETLRPGGHFVCKFYQGSEDKDLERRLKKLFLKVNREKPESSRDESKEMYFVAMHRRQDVDLRETGDA